VAGHGASAGFGGYGSSGDGGLSPVGFGGYGSSGDGGLPFGGSRPVDTPAFSHGVTPGASISVCPDTRVFWPRHYFMNGRQN
jgi:hypothetical protein